MARGLNKVMLIGNLGKDAETRHTQSGTAVTNFSLATARSVKNGQTGEWRDETDWHDVVLWRGENVAQYLTKGTQVFIEGRLQTRSWEKDGKTHYRTEVVCDGASGLTLLGGRGDGSRSAAPSQGQAKSQGQGGDDLGVSDDDLVPF